MTINKTAYDTTACRDFVLDKTKLAISTAYHNGQLKSDYPVFFIEGGDSSINTIPAFAHPVNISTNTDHILVSDMRPFGKWDDSQQQFIIRNTTEYKLTKYRTILNYLWLTESPTILRDISNIGITIFASWLSEAIAKRFALNPREQLDLCILSAIYYNSLFTNENELNEDSKIKITANLAKATRAKADDVFLILDKISICNNLNEYCSVASNVIGSIRIKELNVGLLFSIISGTWFGTNAKEMVAVALEHPPTWLSILLSAFTERTYHNSIITKLAERNSSKDNGKTFIHAVQNLISYKTNR